MKRIRKLLIVVCLSGLAGLYLSGNALAADWSADCLLHNDCDVANVSSSVVRRAYLTAVRSCYDRGALRTELDPSTSQWNYMNAVSNSIKVKLPTGSTDENDSQAGCSDFFFRDTYGWVGLFNVLPSGTSNLSWSAQLEKLGYTVGGSDGGYDKCMKFEMDKYYGDELRETVASDLICADLEDDGDTIKTLGIDQEASSAYASGNFPVKVDKKRSNGKVVVELYAERILNTEYSENGEGDSWNALKEEIPRILGGDFRVINMGCDGAIGTMVCTEYRLHEPREMIESSSGSGSRYVINDMAKAEDDAVEYFSGGEYKSLDSLAVGKVDLFNYYVVLLKAHFFDDKETDDYWQCDRSDWGAYPDYDKDIVITPSRTGGDCKIDTDKTSNGGKVTGFRVGGRNSDKYYFDAEGGTRYNVSQLIDKINELWNGMTPEEREEVAGTEEPTIDPENPDGGADIDCTGAGGMSWLVCDALRWMQKAVEGVYNGYVEPNLRLQPQLFSGDVDGGRSETYEAWGYFRGFANICFVIFLLAVIFSQLTGVGIDNYGIKKILPKLIIAAILVNLSFIICEIGVDLSNILGTALKNMFSGLIDGSIVAFNGVNTGSGLAAVGILAGTGVAAATIAALFTNPAGLLTLLISAIGVMISIFFLFILLAIREAAVVVLVVIAPIAFVLYILPNTKKLFDKWLKFFEAMLLVYPICGLLVGGGDYVSRLLLKVNGASEFAMFTAMIVGIVPIFFIPKVLKGAFSAMGKVGAMLGGLGARVSGTATSKMKGSQLNKNLQERGLERRTRIMAGVDRDGNEKNLTKFGRFIRGGDRNMSRARARYLKDKEARGMEKNLMGAGFATGLAGVDEKINKRRDEDAEAMLAYGRASYVDDDGNEVFVNPGDVESVGEYHEAALKEYHEAGTDSKKQAEALSKIKAAQKLLSKTDGGRARVQNNLESAIAGGYAGGARAAALHLQSNFGDVYKSKNRGANNLINDLASGKGIDEISKSIGNGDYEIAGADKYDQMSLVGADALALKNMSNAVNRISGKIANKTATPDEMEQLNNIRGTAIKAIQMYDAGRLSIKPETLGYIEDIAGVKAQATVSVNGATTTGDTSGISSGGGAGGGTGNGGGNNNKPSGGGILPNPEKLKELNAKTVDKSKLEGTPSSLIGDTRGQEKLKHLFSSENGQLNIDHNEEGNAANGGGAKKGGNSGANDVKGSGDDRGLINTYNIKSQNGIKSIFEQ